MPGPGYYWIGKEEEEEVLELLRSKYLFRYGDIKDTNFKHKVKDLEEKISRSFGIKYSLGVTSGTAALITALSAIGVGPGDEVIVPGYTFIASITSVIICNAVPVLAEVDDSLTLNPEDVERKITPNTKAIMAVHMLGNPCDMNSLGKIAKDHNLILLEDSAQAFGGKYGNWYLGSIGDIGTYSFNFFKTINAGDGGMVVTNNEKLYERAFAYHDQGHLPLRMGVEIGKRSIIGQNYRMNELTAAVLLAQFSKLNKLIERLHYLKNRFKEKIKNIDGVTFRRINDTEGECSTLLTVFFDNKKIADKIAKKLNTITVSHSGWHVYNNMEQLLNMKVINPRLNPLTNQYYKGNVRYYKGMLPETDNLLERAINISIGVVDKGLGAAFGINIDSTDEEIEKKAKEFKSAVNEVL